MASNQNQSTNAVKKIAAVLKESESPLNTTSENNAIAINDGKITLTTDSESSDNYGLGKYFEIETGSTGKNTKTIKLSITRIHIKKEIYKPGYVDVEMTFDNFADFEGSDLDYAQKIHDYFLVVNTNDTDNGISSNTLDVKNMVKEEGSDSEKYMEVYLAKNYFICNVNIEQKEQDSIGFEDINYFIVVKLRAYSPDFFFTLRKYSKAYRSGKNTLSQIISDNINSNYFIDQGDAKAFVSDRLCHTTYDDNNSNPQESIQPYLVQYEESFHDFVVRVANRCGELFYYENGHLILGVNPDNVNQKGEFKINAVEKGIPAKLSFCSLPQDYDKTVNMLSASLVDDGTNTATSGALYSSSNVAAYDQLRRVSKEHDDITYDEVMDGWAKEVFPVALKSKGLDGIITDVTKKGFDVSSAARFATDWSDDSRADTGTILMVESEVKDNNDPISDVPEHDHDSKDIDAFKSNYEAAHKEMFFHQDKYLEKKSDSEAEEVWNSEKTKAHKLLETLKDKIKKAKTHIEVFKENYKTNHPNEFVVITTSKPSYDIFNDVKNGGNKDAHEALLRQQKMKVDLTEDDIVKFKSDYEQSHLEEFKQKGTRKSEEDINNMWMDITTEPGKARLIYIGTHPNKEGEKADVWSQISGKYKSEEWKNPTIEMCKLVRDSRCCPNTEDFKKEYERQNPTYFWDDYTPISDKETVWNDASSAAHKALEKAKADKRYQNDNEIDAFKKRYINEHPQLFTKVKEMSTQDIEKVWNGKSDEKRPYDTLQAYLKYGKGAEYEKILSDIKSKSEDQYISDFKKKHREEDPDKEFLNRDKDELTKEEKDKLWADKDKAPYKALEAFKKNPDYDILKLSNKFYNWIHNIEFNLSRKIQETKIFSRIPSCLLGEFYYFGNGLGEDVYYVYGVDTDIYSDVYISDGAYKTRYNAKSLIKYVPTETHDERNEKYKYQNSVFPPLAEIPHIRKASPQQGVVANVSDPLRCGRVQINYPWCSGVNSPWIPVSTPMAGNGGTDYTNFLMTPEKGEWVIVNYEGGNVERPYVSGSLIHNDVFWGRIPREKKSFRDGHHTITHNGAGITWVDGKGTGPLDVLIPPVAKILDMTYKKEDSLQHKQDKKEWSHSQGGSLILSDYNGFYKIEMDASKRNVTIESPIGSVDINAFTGINISAPNGDIKISGKNVTIDAGNELKLTSGSNIKKNEFKDSVAGLAGKFAGMLAGQGIKTGLTAMTTHVGKYTDIINALGKFADVDLYRHMYEIIFRPVGGTLSLNSKRNLTIEAGKGKAVIPSSALADVITPKASNSIGGGWKNTIKAFGLSGPTAKENAKAKESEDAIKLFGSDTVSDFKQIVNKANIKTRVLVDLITGIKSEFDFYKGYIHNENDPDNRTGVVKDEEYNTSFKALEKAFEEQIPQNPQQDSKEILKGKKDIKILIKLSNEAQASALEQEAYDKVCKCYGNMAVLCDTYKSLWGDKNTKGSFKNAILNYGDEDVLKNIGMDQANFDGFIDAILNKAIIDVLLPNANHEIGSIDALKILISYDQVALNSRVEKFTKLLKRSLIFNFVDKSSKMEQSMNYANSVVNAAGFGKKSEPLTLENLLDDQHGDENYAEFLTRLNFVPDKKDSPSGLAKFLQTAGSSALSEAGFKDIAEYDEDKDSWKLFGKWQKLLNFNGVQGPRSVWDVSSGDGCILVSGGKGTTLKIGAGDQNWRNTGNPLGSIEQITRNLGIE